MKNRNFWELGENVLLFGAGVGSVASVVAQQAFYAAAPLSFLFLLNLMNRRRFEQVTQRSMTATISKIDQQLSGEIHALRQQIVSMPNHTELSGIKSTMTQKQEEGITKLRREITQQLKAFEEKHLGTVRHTIEGMQKQQTQATDAINGLSGYLHRLAPASKVDAIDATIAQLRADFSHIQSTFQTVLNEPKPNLNAFQDQINHINRRLNNLPPPFDPTALKQDIDAIIKLAGDLVPKREVARLIYEIEAVQEQMTGFEQMLTPLRLGATVFKKQLDTVISRIDNGNQTTNEATRAELKNLHSRFAELSQTMEALQNGADRSTSIVAELPESTAVDAVDLADLANATGIDLVDLDSIDLDQQLEEIMQLFDQESTIAGSPVSSELLNLASDSHLEQQLTQLLTRVEQVEQQLLRSTTNSPASHPTNEVSTPSYELMFALQEPQSTISPIQNQSLLEDVLEQAQHSLTIVLPSPAHCNFSDTLLQAIRAFLNRHGHVEIGLGYLSEIDQHRINRCLDPYWQPASHHQEVLYQALKRLTQLKRDYPQQFTFKVLGTDENFLICDRTFAVLGVQNLTIASDLYPGLNIGLRTYDARVIESLSHRFNAPVINHQDSTACFNQALTCYELGDRSSAITHYTQALRLNPQDDIAYNNRGIIYLETGDKQEAIADFQQAIVINPHNTSALFNLAYVKAELDDRLEAIVDYTRAIEHDPRFIAAYFHRGLARTREGDKLGAIADYDQVLQMDPEAAIAYFYRGLAHTKLGNNWSALQDFRQAVPLFISQKNRTHLEKATTMLQKLEQLAPVADPPAKSLVFPPPAPTLNSVPQVIASDSDSLFATHAGVQSSGITSADELAPIPEPLLVESPSPSDYDATITLENVFLNTTGDLFSQSSLVNQPEPAVPAPTPAPTSASSPLNDRSTPVAAKEPDATMTLEHLFPVESDLPPDQFFPSFYELFPDEAPLVSDSGLSFHDLFPDQLLELEQSDQAVAPEEAMLTLEHLF